MKKLFGFALLATLMSSCSSYTLINSEQYVNADLADYHTFRIVTPEDGSLPPSMSIVTYYNIAAAIREQMVERGFVEDPNSPMLINIGLTVNKELVNVPYTQTIPTYGPGPMTPPPPYYGPAYNGMVPYFMYPRAYYWPNYTTVTQWVPSIYKEGVLTMDLVNIVEKKPLYTASVATILGDGNSQLQSLSGIVKAVDVLFSKFPIPIVK